MGYLSSVVLGLLKKKKSSNVLIRQPPTPLLLETFRDIFIRDFEKYQKRQSVYLKDYYHQYFIATVFFLEM
jgi:hypothetical protein